MVLTRQQAQRQDSQVISEADQTTVLSPAEDQQINGERTNMGHNLREPQMYNTDQPRADMPRESFSWSMGDHQGHTSLFNTQSSSQEMSSAMKFMQDKVSSLEHSLQSVTAELRGVLQNFSTNAASQSSHIFNRRNGSEPGAHNETRNRLERRHRPRRENSSDSDDEGRTASSNSSLSFHREIKKSPKLPPFTGKETWKVWFNRFEEVANRQKWSSEEKLDELLPRLQGTAGEFVYEQLSHATRSDYKSLCIELNNRFRVVETSKAFWLQFSHRNQKYGESVEEYAADLKKLYDKAHVRRDRETRKEDLLRRFLDGLVDDKARFHVEFIKEPSDIDEAVYQVVCFQQTKQNNRCTDYTNSRSIKDNNNGSDSEGPSVARAAPGKNKNRKIQNIVKSGSTDENSHKNKETLDLEKLREIIRTELQSMAAKPVQPINQCSQKANQFHSNQNENQQAFYRQPNTGNCHHPLYNNRGKRGCYLCGDLSHYKANCPQNKYKTRDTQPKDGVSNGQDLNEKGLTSQA